MSAVPHSGAAVNDGPHVAWSVLRAGVLGLTAAVVGAALYTAVVILTGYEVGLLAIVLGLGVGFAVAAGHAMLAEGWVRALSVMLTLFSLALSSYLLLWLYDGEGFAPLPISVGEAATTVWDLMYEEPVGWLFWGLALLAAFGVGNREDDPVVEEQVPAQTMLVADPDSGTERSASLVQIVNMEPQPLRAADLELVVVLRTPSGGFLLRRLSVVASDLPGMLPHLFDADSDVLARSANPVNTPRVVDQAYGSADEAMAAAYSQQPSADPDGWIDGADFIASVKDDREFATLLRPDAESIGPLGFYAVLLAGLAIGSAVIYVGYRIDVWLGLDTPERKKGPVDSVFTAVVLILGCVAGWRSLNPMARLLERRNLAKAMAQGSTFGAEPDGVYRARHAAPSSGPGNVGTISDDSADAPLTGRVETPSRLVERPRVRFFWCAGLLASAAASAVVGIVAPDDLGRAGAAAFVGAALVLALVGVASLRWSIVADESGVTVTNLIRRHRIPWTDLKDVKLEKVQADIDLGFHYIVFVTNAGKRIRADAPTGGNQPGGKLPQLRTALLEMRNRYTPSP